MDESLSKRVGAAAAAGWWTILIGAIWLTVAWVIWLVILGTRPAWLLTLWGGGRLTWATVQTITLAVMGAMKGLLLAGLLVVIWLTLWARSLRRQETQ